MRVNGKTQEKFRRNLVHWYQRHHRKLPWRATRDPYKIWVSEIMLQQTRVDVVRNYYKRWLHAFPTVHSLANAPYPRVLKLWEGLGYYSRARNLHQAAKLVVREHRGTLPATVEELMSLPGIGRYTAGAVASIAFHQRAPLVDGNVARVFARVFGVERDVTKPATQKTLWEMAGAIIPQKDPGTFNQALMELGALICTPANPRCNLCPMRGVCVARTMGRQDVLPNRGPRRTHVRIVHDTAWVRRGNKFLLQRRPAKGLLAGMWELPPLAGNGFRSGRQLLGLRHTITNKKIQLRVFECRLSKSQKTNRTSRWVSSEDLSRLTLPAAQRRALHQILSAQ